MAFRYTIEDSRKTDTVSSAAPEDLASSLIAWWRVSFPFARLVEALNMGELAKRHYVALALLAVVAAGHQALVTRDVFHGILHPESVYDLPFTVDPATATISDARGAAIVGLRKGDLLLTVDGVPYTGTHVFDEAIANPHPKGILTVTVRGSAGDKTLRIPLTTLQIANGRTLLGPASRIILYVVMPCFGVILGFWVAVVRPRDPLAWLLLGVMLGFSQLLGGVSTGFWGPWIRDLARAYHLLAGNFWGIAMLLFGLYFPEPFPFENRRVWRWLTWAAVLVMVVCALPDIVVKTVAVERYAAVEWLSRRSAQFDLANTVLTFAAVSVFFISIFVKGSMAVSRDAKRRLRLLCVGSITGLTPILSVVVIGLIKGRTVQDFLPEWLLLTTLLLMFLFPITLAYTIVVQRALDVHVVIRQGLQYALARSGVRVVRNALGAGLIWAAIYALQNTSLRSPLFYAIIAASVLVGFGFRRAGDWLRAWTDRRFFRDAYNTEQILSDLSDKVRTIVDTQSLLATLSQSIAESLHVPQVVALINGSGPYRPAYALGYPELPQVFFAESAATVRQLVEAQEPTRVYLDDPTSWVYRRPDVSEKERRQLQQLGTELLLPLSAQDHLLGFVSLGQKRSEAPYSSTDLRLLKSVSVQTGLALENARLSATVAREVAEREKLNRELEIAREVQQRLFPQKLPQVAGLDYCGACVPALGVGGDYYDFLALPEGHLGIALGDVSGKGIAAALMMATLQASLRAEAMRASGDLAQMIGAVNRLVFDASTSNRYATFFYAHYDPKGRVLTYVNAGHNPPILFRKSSNLSQMLRLEVGGIVIGFLEQFAFQQASLTLEIGDVLVLYTDGVSEAMDVREEEWGEKRLMEAIERCQSLTAAQTIEYVMGAAGAFASGAPQHDDMTLVVLRVN